MDDSFTGAKAKQFEAQKRNFIAIRTVIQEMELNQRKHKFRKLKTKKEWKRQEGDLEGSHFSSYQGKDRKHGITNYTHWKQKEKKKNPKSTTQFRK